MVKEKKKIKEQEKKQWWNPIPISYEMGKHSILPVEDVPEDRYVQSTMWASEVMTKLLFFMMLGFMMIGLGWLL